MAIEGRSDYSAITSKEMHPKHLLTPSRHGKDTKNGIQKIVKPPDKSSYFRIIQVKKNFTTDYTDLHRLSFLICGANLLLTDRNSVKE